MKRLEVMGIAGKRDLSYKIGLSRDLLIRDGEKQENVAQPAAARGKAVNADPAKYFSAQQIRMLRKAVKKKADDDARKGRTTGIREWIVVDLLTSAGIKAAEAANLRCGDLKISNSDSRIFISNRKGRFSGYVVITDTLKEHLKSFLVWKINRGEGTEEDDHLFIGQRGAWTGQAIQQIVKKILKKLGMYESEKSVRALRLSYARELYSRVKEMRVVQKQLHHLFIPSETAYPDAADETLRKKIKGLWR